MNKIVILLALVLIAGLNTGVNAQAPSLNKAFSKALANAKPVTDTSKNGTVNYSDQYVEAEGHSIIDTTRFKNKAQAIAMARRGATVDAQRNLLEIIQGVNVQGETTVKDLITESDVVITRVQGLVKGAVMQGKPVIADGEVTVVLRIPMYAKNGLAPAIIDQLPKADSIAKADATKNNAPKTLSPPATTDGTSAATPAPTTETGNPVAFKIKGDFNPSMFPVIVDDKGQVQLDMSKLYNAESGKFPKILQTSKEVMKDLGLQKGVDIVNLVQDKSTGYLTVADSKKINWGKVGNTIGKIGKVLLSILL